MAGNAFTAGVKPGGLTTSTEIKILLCYLLQQTGAPLSRKEIETALVGEELVNYFELMDHLSELCKQGFLCEEAGSYRVLPAGEEIADMLADDVPRSVRETAVRAALAARQYAHKEAQHHVEIVPAGEKGYTVKCSLRDMGSDIFGVSLYMPDRLTAQLARERFIEHGDDIYRLMLAALTKNAELSAELLEQLSKQQ